MKCNELISTRRNWDEFSSSVVLTLFVCLCFSQWVIISFSLSMSGLSIFISSLSCRAFWHFICVCLYSRSFSASLSFTCFLPLCLRVLPSIPLQYLSQRALMWPLCAVSSPRGRQSSCAPIRTALSGAVSTTGQPACSSIDMSHPPPTVWDVERQEKSKWHREGKTKSQRKRKILWLRRYVLSPLLHPSLTHSLLPCLSSIIPH